MSFERKTDSTHWMYDYFSIQIVAVVQITQNIANKAKK